MPSPVTPTATRISRAERKDNGRHDNRPTGVKNLRTNPRANTCAETKIALKMNPVVVWASNVIVVLFHGSLEVAHCAVTNCWLGDSLNQFGLGLLKVTAPFC